MASRRTGPLLLLLGLLLAGLVALVGWRLRGASDEPRPTAPATVATRAAPAEPTDRALEAPEQAAVPDADPAPAPTAARTLSSRSQGSEPERTAAADPELAAAWWVEGRVVLPPGTPLDERVEIEADGRDFEHRPHHRVEVGPDGSFRVAFSERTRHGRLQVHARHLYDPDPERFDVRDVEGELPPLELALGGRIEGQVILPADATEEERASLVGTPIRISGPTQRSVQLDGDLRFAADALEPDGDYGLKFGPQRFMNLEIALRVDPGETRTVPLEPRRGVRLTGSVRLDDGEVPPSIWLSVDSEGAGLDDHAFEQVPEDGVFDLWGLTPGVVTVEARAEGALELERELGELADGDSVADLHLVLSRGAAVSGSMSWPDGSPAAEIGVHVEQEVEEENWTRTRELETETDAEGRFELTGLHAGPYELVARAREETAEVEGESRADRRRRQQSAPLLTVQHTGSAPAAGLALVLEPGSVIRGRALDERGRPVEDFTVRLRPPEDDAEFGLSRRVRSVDGRFALEGPAPGIWRIDASARGHVDAEMRIIEVPLGEELQLELARAPRVSGHVTGPDGRVPPRRARVSVRHVVSGAFGVDGDSSSRFADRDGGFALEGLVGSVRIVASCEGLASSEPVELELGAAQVVDDLALRLRVGGRIEGRREGELHPGGRIGLMGSGSVREMFGSMEHTVADADGSFVFAGLDPGVYRVAAVPEDMPGYVAWQLGEEGVVEVEVEDGRTSQVVLGPPGEGAFVLRGLVVRGGAPLSGARVWTRDKHTRMASGETDASGRFELTLACEGNYELVVTRPEGNGGYTHRVEVASAGVTEVVIDVSGATVAGVVTVAGQPIDDVHLQVRGAQGTLPIWGSTDEQGRFELGPVPDGRHVLRIEQSGFGAVERDLVVEDGRSLSGLVIALEPGGSLAGRLRTPEGDPVLGAAIFVRVEGGAVSKPWSTTVSGSAGDYVVERAPPGRVVVLARTTRAFGQSRPVMVTSGGEATADVVLAPATLLGLEVRDPGGEPRIEVLDRTGLDHAGLHCHVEWSRRVAGATHTVGPVPPGSYRVRVTFSDGVVVERELTVDGEPSRSLELAHP